MTCEECGKNENAEGWSVCYRCLEWAFEHQWPTACYREHT